MEFRSGLEVLRRMQDSVKMTAGDDGLDSLLGGGIEPGLFYLFYGDGESGIDYLIHRIMVGSLLSPMSSGFRGRCIYVNCGNYRRERTILDTGLLCHLVKAAKLDVNEALDRIYTVCSFSEEQEERALDEVEDLIRRDRDVRLVVVHNIAKLFTTNGGAYSRVQVQREKTMRLQGIVHRLWRLCAENGLALVASCRPAGDTARGEAKPEGGEYLRHKAAVIVHLRRIDKGYSSACLVKHPSLPPSRVILKHGLGGASLGRITPSFRTLLQGEVDKLKRSYRDALMDPGCRRAFESLVEAWSREQGAMSNSETPTVLEVMLLTAAVDNRRTIMELLRDVEAIRSRLDKVEGELQRRI
ncbi:MAG: hypothetical protein QXH67_07285, partial [Candidatus Bathyarchaeia archaeon]